MDFEPDIPPPRPAEALMIVLDCGPSVTRTAGTHAAMRDVAMRMARTRLIYSATADDCIGVVKIGSRVTSNAMADENPGGYSGIEVVLPVVSRSLDAVRQVRDMAASGESVNLCNVLDCAGHIMATLSNTTAERKRVVLFTDGGSLAEAIDSQDFDDIRVNCRDYRACGITIDVVCTLKSGGGDGRVDEDEEMSGSDDDDDDDDDALAKLDADEAFSEYFQKYRHRKHSHLRALARAVGGTFYDLKDASKIVDLPAPIPKRATAKYAGTLNIADEIHIPVKVYSHVAEAKNPSATRISWEASRQFNEPVGVHVETQKVASARDDEALREDQLVKAFPYGPDLVVEENEVDSYAWGISLPRGMDVIGFVNQSEIEDSLVLGKVDVVVPMRGVKEANQALSALVTALYLEKMGIVVRYVASKHGGAPKMMYLWPALERCRQTGDVKNRFLYMIELPMREDIRDYRFASLKETAASLPASSEDMMDRFVEARMLNPSERFDDDSDEEEPFWPTNYCNPTLDRFQIAVVQRALDGLNGTQIPPLSDWQKHLLEPGSFIRPEHKDAAERALRELRSLLPIVKVKPKAKRSGRVYHAVSGDVFSIVEYVPVDDEGDGEDEGDDIGIQAAHAEDRAVYRDRAQGLDADDASLMTDMYVEDVGESTPVADFENLVRRTTFGYAAESLNVVIRRLIRDANDEKAMRCMQALRKESAKGFGTHRFYNDLLTTLLRRGSGTNQLGNRTAAFFRFVRQHSCIDSALAVIPPPVTKEKDSENERINRERLNGISRDIEALSSLDKVAGLSASVVSA